MYSARSASLAVLGAMGALPLLAILSLRIPWVEQHAVYQHRLTLLEGRDQTIPEQFGFAPSQVTSFYIKSEGGIRLHAWHVLPIGVYRRHYLDLIKNEQRNAPSGNSEPLSLQLLRGDPEARLVIHTHGSSGALAAYCRPEAYRSLSSASPDKIHVLAFDYRGFGLSSGSPTEEGLIVDALSVFRWATEVARVPAERIVIFGQSMGGGAAIALVRTLALEQVPVAGLVITSSFPSVPALLSEYRIFGLPVLGPLTRFPRAMAILASGMRNRWPNKERLADVVRLAPTTHIEIFHALDDPIVPWHFSNDLFRSAVDAATENKILTHDEFEKQKNARKVDLGNGGWYVEWPTANGFIRHEMASYGVHDKIMSHPQIAMAVARVLRI